MAEGAHLAYAATAYGVQGATLTTAHTLLSDALDAAGVYVGMTRGRERNTLHVVATDFDDAKQQFSGALTRDRADRGLQDATERAREATTGLVTDGPVSIVNAERERIAARIEKTEREREHWVSAFAKLRDQSEKHEVERRQQEQLVVAADTRVAQALAEAVPPRAQKATTEGRAYLNAQEEAFVAHRARAGARPFRKRAAARTAKTADARRAESEQAIRERWQSLPHNEASLSAWAESVAQREANAMPEVVEAREAAKRAHAESGKISTRQTREHLALYQRMLGSRQPSVVAARIKRLRKQAAQDRRCLAQLEGLPPEGAAPLVRERAEQAEAERLATEGTRRAAEARTTQIDAPWHGPGRGRSPYRDGPSLRR